MRQIPYLEMRLGRLVYTNDWPNSPPYEKGIDILLTTDLLTHSFRRNYDVAILVGGDTDYVGAIQAVKNNGQNAEVALFGSEATSRDLREMADRVLDIDGRFLRGCWKQALPPPQDRMPEHAAEVRTQPEPAEERPSGETPQAQPQPQPYRSRRPPFHRRRPRRSSPSGTETHPETPGPASEPPPTPPLSSLW